MKTAFLHRVILLFVLLNMAFCGGVRAAEPTPGKSLVFDEKIHDFGEIDEMGGKAVNRFRFTNRSEEPVALLYARTGCTCVTATVPKRPVNPGETAYVEVSYDPEYRPGHFSKEIAVISETSKGKEYNRIWVKGDVKPGRHPITDKYRYCLGHNLYANLKVMNFGTVRVGQTKTMALKFGSDCEITMNIDFQVRNPETGVFVPAGFILRPFREGRLDVEVRATKSGECTTEIVPVVNGYSLEPIKVVFNAVK